MMTPKHTTHSYHKRFYMLLTTVIVGAILILMLVNDKGEIDFLTGSSVGVEEGIEKESLREISKGGEIAVELNFDTAPEVNEKTGFRLMMVTFDDLSTKIRINEEELELKGLEDVEMEIEDFGGEINFDELSISLTGEGEKIVINGIEISTKGKMEISFKNLVYETLKLEGVKLGLVDFREGSGGLALGEKLNYVLENEELELRNFEGDLGVGWGNESFVVMEGEISGISVEGEFDLTLS